MTVLRYGTRCLAAASILATVGPTACDAGLEPVTDGELSPYVSTTTDSLGRLQATLTIVNPTAYPDSVILSAQAPLQVAIYWDSIPRGEPVWSGPDASALVGLEVKVPPGKSEKFSYTVDVSSLHRQGIVRDGDYAVAVYVDWSQYQGSTTLRKLLVFDVARVAVPWWSPS